ECVRATGAVEDREWERVVVAPVVDLAIAGDENLNGAHAEVAEVFELSRDAIQNALRAMRIERPWMQLVQHEVLRPERELRLARPTIRRGDDRVRHHRHLALAV